MLKILGIILSFLYISTAWSEMNSGSKVDILEENSDQFLCQDLTGFFSDIQKTVALQQCQTLEAFYEDTAKNCDFSVFSNLEGASQNLVSMTYDIAYHCPSDISSQKQKYTYNWLKDGRLVDVKAVWYSLFEAQRQEILTEVVQSQSASALCPKPLEPTRIKINAHTATFSDFYGHMGDGVQQEACDVAILRPAFFMDGFLEAEGSQTCQTPIGIASRSSQLSLLIDFFLKDINNQALAQQVWELFPKNYLELSLMAGTWWQPGWENFINMQAPINWQDFYISQFNSQDICLGSLYYRTEKDLSSAWYALYNHIDPQQWMQTNLKFQGGLWQADTFNYMATLHPQQLSEVWDREAEAQVWKKISIDDLVGLIVWYNSAPSDESICLKGNHCSLINPIPIENLALDDDEKQQLNQKIQQAMSLLLKTKEYEDETGLPDDFSRETL